MALGDEQIDRLTKAFDAMLKARIEQADAIFDAKIAKVEDLLKRFSATATISTTLLDIQKPG